MFSFSKKCKIIVLLVCFFSVVLIGCTTPSQINTKKTMDQLSQLAKSEWKIVEEKCAQQDFEFKENDSYWLIKKYRTNIYKNPQNPEVYFLYGRLLGLFQKEDEAIPYFYHALDKNPEYIWSFYAIGITYLNKKARNEARFFLQKCIDLDSGFVPSYIALAKAEIFSNTQGALSLLQRVEQLDPNNAFIKQNIANAFSAMGNYPQALIRYQEAHNIDNTNVDILSDWSKVLLKLKKYSTALEILQKIHDMLPPGSSKKEMEKTIALVMALINQSDILETVK